MISTHIGEKFQTQDGYTCEITKRITFGKPPCQCQYEVKFEDGQISTFAYKTLQHGIVKSRIRKYKTMPYIGRQFISKDGYTCTIIRQSTFGQQLCHCRYEVEFEDHSIREFEYSHIASGEFYKIRPNSILRKTYYSTDGFCCTIKSQLEDSVEVEFEDGYTRTIKYHTLVGKNFSKYPQGYMLDREYVSRDGYKYSVINESQPGKYTVKFEDGTTKIYSRNSIANRKVRRFASTYENLLGQRFTNTSDESCVVVKQTQLCSIKSKCKYLVEFEDGYQEEFGYTSLKQGTFQNHNPNKYVGKSFKGLDDYVCTVTKRLTYDKTCNNSMYEVEFEDGSTGRHTLKCLKSGKFKKYDSRYIDKLSTINHETIDGYRYEILENLTPGDSSSRCQYKIRFEDGLLQIRHYSSIMSGFYKYTYNNLIQIITTDVIKGHHLCRCTKCGMKNILTYDEIFEHEKLHKLKEENKT